MKINFPSVFALLLVSVITTFAQTASPTPSRPRVVPVASQTPFIEPTPIPKIVVVTNNLPTPAPTPVQTPRPASTVVPTALPSATPYTVNRTPLAQPVAPANFPVSTAKVLPFGQLQNKIEEAKRLMQSRPIPTAMTTSFLVTDVVRIAFYDWTTSRIDFAVLTKESFLSRDAQIPLTTTNGKFVTIRIIRANGVNTPVTIFDSVNQAHTPLVVQYPIERGGRFAEMAYYVSTHPGVVTPEVVNAGKLYVRNTIDIARQKLQQKGYFISAQSADIAERLSTVEHVDHQRFRNEYHPNIYNDIFTLYALNAGNTYRYSVSSAGAGGMVQMIPSTYRMIRSRYFNVNLLPDFVEGMRNHDNAAQAMLLYIQLTWNDLVANSTITQALADGLATPAELMSAGYNSNPAKLAGYIRRGGTSWRNLIPRETQIYLQIYASLERHVQMTPRTK